MVSCDDTQVLSAPGAHGSSLGVREDAAIDRTRRQAAIQKCSQSKDRRRSSRQRRAALSYRRCLVARPITKLPEAITARMATCHHRATMPKRQPRNSSAVQGTVHTMRDLAFARPFRIDGLRLPAESGCAPVDLPTGPRRPWRVFHAGLASSRRWTWSRRSTEEYVLAGRGKPCTWRGPLVARGGAGDMSHPASPSRSHLCQRHGSVTWRLRWTRPRARTAPSRSDSRPSEPRTRSCLPIRRWR